MIEALMWLLICAIPTLAWLCGYCFGKADGIREVRHFMDEQWKDYKSFRDLAFRELGIREVEP